MGSSFNDLFKAFGKINGLKKTDLSSHISVNNSSNVTITGNQFNQSVSYIYNELPVTLQEQKPETTVETDFKTSMAMDKTDRAMLNIDYIDRFIFECNRSHIIPTIRCYAFFSHISSIRSKWDKSEYNQLILSEKDLFDTMLELKYHVKLIICMDVPVILQKWYDSTSDMICRLTDLTDKIDGVCANNNIEVVVDGKNSMDGCFILQDSLYIHALNADPIHKYNITRYETNKTLVHNAILLFDEKFNNLTYTNRIVKEFLKTTSMSDFIKKKVDAELEAINFDMSKR